METVDLKRPAAALRQVPASPRAGSCSLGVLCVAAIIAFAAAAAEPVPAGVLIIHSNQRPTPANVVIEDTLRKVVPEGFKRPGRNVFRIPRQRMGVG